MKKEAGFVFIFFGLLALLGGSFFGCIAALQFVFPEFLKDIPFVKTRPLHVSLVVAWIFFSAIGVIYYFLQNNSKVKIFSDTIPKIHFWTFLFTGALILACYVLGIFGGREYWEFPAILSIPIFITLTLAIAISVPAINVYTHGTHVTVAHAMGSTIGINTMILLASCVFLVLDAIKVEFRPSQKRMIHSGFWVLNFSLLIFWLCLIFAGIEKGMLVIENKLTFSEIMERINPTLTLFAFSGLGIFSGLIIIVLPTLKTISFYWTKK